MTVELPPKLEIPFPMYRYRAKLLRVVDGDTVNLEIDLGLDVKRQIKCRLFGLNAPEKNTAEGKAAAAWLVERLARCKSIVAETIKDRTEKYGRYLVELCDESGAYINGEMLRAGMAKEYYGVGMIETTVIGKR